ncbi:hypothetical protein PsorP6_017973 [Peronosclerospora sorghi]|uniref:Uncharacterized protein n=1 Tax=Peronosclerospora sorghi TaxID=230839 RepID=A0ACC0WD35_9STRA|nr:hypothetical protein PsorP6_017973 [Peronosclerospora sorghi]
MFVKFTRRGSVMVWVIVVMDRMKKKERQVIDPKPTRAREPQRNSRRKLWLKKRQEIINGDIATYIEKQKAEKKYHLNNARRKNAESHVDGKSSEQKLWILVMALPLSFSTMAPYGTLFLSHSLCFDCSMCLLSVQYLIRSLVH